MTASAGITFNGESAEYRRARNELLEEEAALRRKVEQVAALRRGLPLGHQVTQDYEFQSLNESGHTTVVKLSELFANPNQSLVIYGLMYDKDSSPCPMCTSFLDSFDGAVRHAAAKLNIAVVAKGPIELLASFAKQRGWENLNILSSAHNTFNKDFFTEVPGAGQVPIINVFQQSNGNIHHFYTSELFFDAAEPGQHPRHMDMMFPLWNLFDLTPEGRPNDWFPSVG